MKFRVLWGVLAVLLFSNMTVFAQSSSYTPFEYAFDLPDRYEYFDGETLVIKDRKTYEFFIYILENGNWVQQGYIANQGGEHGYSIRVAGIQNDILILKDFARCHGDHTGMNDPSIQIYSRDNGVWSHRSTYTDLDIGYSCFNQSAFDGTTFVLSVDGPHEIYEGRVYSFEIENYELIRKQRIVVDENVWQGYSFGMQGNKVLLHGDTLFVEAEQAYFPLYNVSRNNVYRVYNKIDGLWVEDEAALLRLDERWNYPAKYPILNGDYLLMQNVIYIRNGDKWEVDTYFDGVHYLEQPYFTNYAFKGNLMLGYQNSYGRVQIFIPHDNIGYSWLEEQVIDQSSQHISLDIINENMIRIGNKIYTRNMTVPTPTPPQPVTPTATPTSTTTPIGTEDVTPPSTEDVTPISTEDVTPTPVVTEDVTPVSTEEITPTPVVTEDVTPISTEEITPTPAHQEAAIIDNGGFEQIDNWTIKHSSGDKLKCNTATKTFAYEGVCAFQFKNVEGEKGKLIQPLALDSAALAVDDTVRFSVMAKTKQGATVKAQVVIKHGDQSKDKIVLLLEDAPEYREFVGETQLTDTVITQAVLKFKGTTTRGKVWIDAVQVTHLPVTLQPLPTE